MLALIQTKVKTIAALLIAGILSVFTLVCSAEDIVDERPIARQVVLEGVLGSKAILAIDGQRQLLGKGMRSQDGKVRVLRVTPDFVDVEISGKQRQLRLGDSSVITSPYKQRESTSVIIARGANGMYSTVGSINGLTVSFLVDTGATTIAMNSGHARRLAIDYRVVGEPTVVGTASGITKAYRVTLDTVTVGEITMRNISAVVMDGRFPVQVLLGMSFLGQLEIQREGAIMHLKKKF